MRLERFNTLSDPQVVSLLVACAAVPWWAAAITDDRPYPTRQALLDDARAKAARWECTDVREALAYHKPLGSVVPGRDVSAAMARAEQVGLQDLPEETARRLADGNRLYAERFGYVFLVRVAGRTPEEVLAALDTRLANSPEAERRVAADSLREVAILRLASQITD